MAKHRQRFQSGWRGEYYFLQNQWRFFAKPTIKRKFNQVMSYLCSFIGR